jgi:uncharacterized membrane protein
MILLLSLSLGVYKLAEESLWLDEGVSARIAQTDKAIDILDPGLLDDNPPFYYILLHFWIKYFGNSEFSLRFPSLIFNLVSVLMIYLVSVLLFNCKTGLLSALLVALSGYHLYFAQEARNYTLLGMEALFSMYFYIRLSRRFNWASSFGYILSSSLMLYTHPYGLFLILAQNLHVFIFAFLSPQASPIRWKHWITVQILLLISFVPWIGVILQKIVRIQTAGLLWEPSIMSVLGALKKFSGNSAFLGAIFIFLAAFAIINWTKNNAHEIEKKQFGLGRIGSHRIFIPQFEQVSLLSFWLWTPILLPFIISKVSTPILQNRYLIGASFAFYILVSRGITKLNNRYLTAICMAVIILLYPIDIFYHYTRVDKEPWRDVVKLVEKKARNGDSILVNANFCYWNIYQYYSERTDLDIIPFPEKDRDIHDKNIQQLNFITPKYDRIWLVLSHQGKNIDMLKKHLTQTHRLVHHWPYYKIHLYLYEKHSDSSGKKTLPLF